ncbi:MAG: glutamate 5-kinase [Clostridiaceae bacterium]|nr:glutamate 5-kinase [Clostridiaceae bacterium]
MTQNLDLTSVTAAEAEVRRRVAEAQRVVIKVGTSSITHTNGRANLAMLERLCWAIVNELNREREVILVTSGAIAIGMGRLQLTERPTNIREKQALAAVGQCDLMNIYSRIMNMFGHTVAQILLTKDDIEDELTRTNVMNTFEALLERGVLPIVNENDTVSTLEVWHNGSFGDNDTLSAHVARVVGADLLILLSDIDGLYACDPRLEPEAELLTFIPTLTPEIMSCATSSSSSKRGTGGMRTKLLAAEMATAAGIDMVIANGNRPENITGILEGEGLGSLFPRKGTVTE